MKSRVRTSVLLLSAAWMLAAIAGLLALADYSSKPGDPARPPQHWPGGVSLARHPAQSTLLMFLHPHCPCSQASLSELARLSGREREPFDLSVVFVQPAGVAAGWAQSGLWESAVANGEWHVILDPGGVLAQRFGVQTSGQVLVYDREGQLRLDGGITPGRGHVGDSVGRSLVQALSAGPVREGPASCATFGCPLSTERPFNDP